MSSESLALSDIWVGTPDETEYDGVYAAVMATERGRWFLTEYANRNRQTDTHAVLGALARLETAVRSRTHEAEAPAKAANGTEQMRSRQMLSPDVAAAAERIQDIAFMLRERAADADLCDALDAAVREIAGACCNSIRICSRDKIEPISAADDSASSTTSRLLSTEPQEPAEFTEPIANQIGAGIGAARRTFRVRCCRAWAGERFGAHADE